MVPGSQLVRLPSPARADRPSAWSSAFQGGSQVARRKERRGQHLIRITRSPIPSLLPDHSHRSGYRRRKRRAQRGQHHRIFFDETSELIRTVCGHPAKATRVWLLDVNFGKRWLVPIDQNARQSHNDLPEQGAARRATKPPPADIDNGAIDAQQSALALVALPDRRRRRVPILDPLGRRRFARIEGVERLARHCAAGLSGIRGVGR